MYNPRPSSPYTLLTHNFSPFVSPILSFFLSFSFLEPNLTLSGTYAHIAAICSHCTEVFIGDQDRRLLISSRLTPGRGGDLGPFSFNQAPARATGNVLDSNTSKEYSYHAHSEWTVINAKWKNTACLGEKRSRLHHELQ